MTILKILAYLMIWGQIVTLPLGMTIWKDKLEYVVVQSALANIFGGLIFLYELKMKEENSG